MTRFIIIFSILFVLGLAFFFAQQAYAPTAPNIQDTSDSGDGATSTERDISSEYAEYSTEIVQGVYFSVTLPSDVESNTISSNRYEFKYIGPNAEPNTEITDGYYLSMFISQEADIRSYAPTSTNFVETTVAGRDAIRYTEESELGTLVTHYVVAVDEASLIVDFAYSVHGTDTSEYETEVVGIIQSLSFNEANADDYIESKADLIRVNEPTTGNLISSPLAVSGEARGYWFFEASFPVTVVDWDGRIIAEHYATAEGEWMTEEFVPFTAELEFESPYREGDPEFMQRGTLILKRANASGLPEHDNALEIPIRFTP